MKKQRNYAKAPKASVGSMLAFGRFFIKIAKGLAKTKKKGLSH